MAGITDVLERLVTDPSFKQELNRDPRAALAGYELTDDDLRVLATQVSDDGGDHVETRTSRSALFSLFTQIGDAAGGVQGGGRAEPVDVPEEPSRTRDSDGDGLPDTYEPEET